MLARFTLALLGMCLTASVFAQESTMRWLDNRFRVDPSIEKITFMVHRNEGTASAVLIRPDGSKLYAREHPEDVDWYQDSSMDIVTVDSPMPGPWQAMGKISTENGIKLISNITMQAEDFPDRLYQGERLKFTAAILQDGTPMLDEEFLRRVALQVEFVKANDVSVQRQPMPTVIGEFTDDGSDFDEVPFDGTFTVGLTVDLEPGRYLARVNSSNGIFMRSVDKEVLVYPSPMQVNFIQGRNAKEKHTLSIEPEKGAFLPGSLSVHVEQTMPNGRVLVEQAQAMPEQTLLSAKLTNPHEPGQYLWQAWVYATTVYNQRGVVIALPQKSFAIRAELQFDSNLEEFRRATEERERQEAAVKLAAEKAENQKKLLMVGLIVNLILVVIAVVIAVVVKKRRSIKLQAADVDALAEPD